MSLQLYTPVCGGIACSRSAPKNMKLTPLKIMSKYKYTCWHCRAGMVIKLPAQCPECGKILVREVKQ